jgi:hypothetical protein
MVEDFMGWRRYVAMCGALSVITLISACGSGTPAELSFSKLPTAMLDVGAQMTDRISVTDQSAAIRETGALPAGVALAVGADGTATLSGTPAAGAGGQYPVVLSASDGGRVISKAIVLTVDQAPRFPAIDNSTFVGKMFSHDETQILTTGYPAATISYQGTLPSSFSLVASARGTATITAAPGSFETPCDTEITITAANAAGSASFSLLLKIASFPCPCNLVCSTFEKSPLQIGGAVVTGGKFVGQKIFKGSQDVGQTVERDGDAVAIACEEDCEEAAAAGEGE